MYLGHGVAAVDLYVARNCSRVSGRKSLQELTAANTYPLIYDTSSVNQGTDQEYIGEMRLLVLANQQHESQQDSQAGSSPSLL